MYTVDITTLFLGKPTKQMTGTKLTFLRHQLPNVPFEEGNGCRNSFMTKSAQKNLPAVWSISGPTATRNRLRTRY